MLKGGIVGFGRMGLTHYSILNTNPDIEFVAISDSSDFMLDSFRRFTSIKLFNDYRKMLNEVELDFIIVSTPTASHAEIISLAIEKNIHIFVEKPFSLSPHEGRQIVAAIEKTKLVNQVGYYMRFNVIFNEIKKMLDEGLIGEVSHYKNEMYGRTVLKGSKTSWRSKKESGGGCLMDFGIHCIDLSDYLFGPIANVSGSILKSLYSSHVDDSVYSNLEHANGVTGNLIVCWSDESYRRPYNRLEMFGSNGKIIADKQEFRVYLRNPVRNSSFKKGWNIRYLPETEKGVRFDLRGSDFTHQLDSFINCIKNDIRDSRCNFATGLRSDIVVDDIKKDFVGRSK